MTEEQARQVSEMKTRVQDNRQEADVDLTLTICISRCRRRISPCAEGCCVKRDTRTMERSDGKDGHFGRKSPGMPWNFGESRSKIFCHVNGQLNLKRVRFDDWTR